MRIELNTNGVPLDGEARARAMRRLEASLGRVAMVVGRVHLRLADGRDVDHGGCPGRDRFVGSLRVRLHGGPAFSLRGEDDDPETLAVRLAERAGRVVRRRVGGTRRTGRWNG